MIPGDHIRSKKVKGGEWLVTGSTETHVLVRCRTTGTPARISRNEVDRWRTVWSPELSGPGLEGLRREGRMLVRVDA